MEKNYIVIIEDPFIDEDKEFAKLLNSNKLAFWHYYTNFWFVVGPIDRKELMNLARKAYKNKHIFIMAFEPKEMIWTKTTANKEWFKEYLLKKEQK